MGRNLSREFEQNAVLSSDPALIKLVDRIGRTLAPNSDSLNPVVLRVVDTNETNVFTLPGGYVYVTSGLVRTAGTEAELAWAIAWGFASLPMSSYMRIGETRSLLPPITQVREPLFTGGILGLTSSYQQIADHLRRDVEQTDLRGLQLLFKSGYDPGPAATFLQRVEAVSRARVTSQGFSDGFPLHPPISKRIKNLQESARKLPQGGKSLVSTQEFDEVRSRLAF